MITAVFRTSRPYLFFKIDVLKKNYKFTEKHQCCSFLFDKVAAGASTGIFMWILRNIYEHLFKKSNLWSTGSSNCWFSKPEMAYVDSS